MVRTSKQVNKLADEIIVKVTRLYQSPNGGIDKANLAAYKRICAAVCKQRGHLQSLFIHES